MEAKEAIWKRCLEKIEQSILPDSYATWFSPTYPSNLDNGLITISVPNQFYRKCLIENYRELIENTLKTVSNEPILVDFCIGSIFAELQNRLINLFNRFFIDALYWSS